MYQLLENAVHTAQSLRRYRKSVECLNRDEWLKILDLRDKFNDDVKILIISAKEIINHQCTLYDCAFNNFAIILNCEIIINNRTPEWYFEGANKQLGHNITFYYPNIELAFNRCAEYFIDIGVKNNEIKIKSKNNGHNISIMPDQFATEQYMNCCKAIYDIMKKH